MKRKLIAVMLLGLVSTQAGVAFADNSDILADPYWAPRDLKLSNSTPRVIDAAQPSGYDLADRFNP